ncbi:VanZ family protein [Bacillus timonensis]|nr:VanZ family protein [Bacillus timonensis]
MIQAIFRTMIKLAPFLYMTLIWVLSSLPQDAVIKTPFSFDGMLKESLHLVEFAILYCLFVLYFLVDRKLTTITNKFAALIAISYGFIDEFHQYFVPYRSATMIDLVKDTLGVLIVYYLVNRYYFSGKPSRIKNLLQRIEGF